MNNEGLTSNSKASEHVARMDASFYKVVTVQNTSILFWIAFALYLLYTSYVPPVTTANGWIILLARTLFLSTIGLWIIADGRVRNIDKQWLVIYFYCTIYLFLVVFSLPIYLVHSRGWIGAGKSTLRFAGYLLLALLIFAALVGVLHLFGINGVGTPTFQ